MTVPHWNRASLAKWTGQFRAGHNRAALFNHCNTSECRVFFVQHAENRLLAEATTRHPVGKIDVYVQLA